MFLGVKFPARFSHKDRKPRFIMDPLFSATCGRLYLMIKKVYIYGLLKNVLETFGEGRRGIDLPSKLNVEQKPCS